MTRVVEVEDREIEVSNPDKVLFPGAGITKWELAEFYRRVGGAMLPHVAHRAVSMQRFPDGIGAGGFFQKEASAHFPDWIRRASLPKEGGSVNHVVVDEVATLVYLADQACITPHVSLSRVDRPQSPDRMVFDLDPPGTDLPTLHRAVNAVRSIVEEAGLSGLLMTTGSKGYHVVVPLDRSADFDLIRGLALRLSELVASRHPEMLTTEHRKAKRQDRVFVDYLRNGYAQTTVAPYGVRALPNAPVATPLEWAELGRSTPGKYNIKNLFRRLSQKDDPWDGLDRLAGTQSASAAQLEDLAASVGRDRG